MFFGISGNRSVKDLHPAVTAVVAAGDDVSVRVVPAEDDSNNLEEGSLVATEVTEASRLR